MTCMTQKRGFPKIPTWELSNKSGHDHKLHNMCAYALHCRYLCLQDTVSLLGAEWAYEVVPQDAVSLKADGHTKWQ